MFKSKTKTCQNCKSKFTIEPEDFEFYEKIGVPAPTFCPECRLKRRLVFRNERNLYKRKCNFSDKEIFSALPKHALIKVYDLDIWNSDKWDVMKYNIEYDFNKLFFKQLKELMKKVPLPSKVALNLINSDYSMNSTHLKNCYFVFNGTYDENCAYSNQITYSKDSYDNLYMSKCELCYDGFALADCYKVFYSINCTDCQEVYLSKNLVNCHNCFGCTNLRHKKYHIFNKPYIKSEYFKELEKFNLGSYQSIIKLKQKAYQESLKYPNKFIHGKKNVNVSGDYLYNCKNVKNSYDNRESENLKYCQNLIGKDSSNSYDFSVAGTYSNLVYESLAVSRGINTLKFCINCYPDCRNMEYCMHCFSSSNLFACVGLRHKQYCILNKQYTKEEYEELVPKIKQHMNDMPYTDKKGRVYKYGEFFPSELSPFGYNETIANEYFPLTKKQAIEQGYNWYDKEKNEYEPTIKAKDLPDNIKDVNNNILKEVIQCNSKDCAGSGVFRIIPQELKFYKKMNIPLPHLCPDCRHRERIKQRNPLKLYTRQCMNKGCNNTFETTYAPDRKDIVYCEKCYNMEVG